MNFNGMGASLAIIDSIFSTDNNVWFMKFVNGNQLYFFRLRFPKA
jgi:hypothetical protein